ncbi:type II toxin-antitoxin system VapC family toxin [Myceligenerans xiligouense]|uniref:type II toxin-antitoxin system VapC family toxin n=1 Tax=Myceligenerans xiligouense TaxID=253184 RepID=UPI001476F2C2|nr:type II toxin-antitoxin system VapC family toxin [Myceligenerans xiligouense]
MSAQPLVVDTSVFIDHLRGVPEARDALIGARRFGRRVTASVLTRTELLGGMRSPEKSKTHALLDVIDWIEVDERVADAAGRYARTYRRSHSTIDIADYVIAATADVTGGALWTCNLKHYPMFPGLKAPY